MRFLIVADTHGNISRLNQVVEKHHDEIDGIIHLGDFSQDMNSICFINDENKYSCIGNMDGISRKDSDYEKIIELSGEKILMTHSDHLQTHYDLNNLFHKAKELGVDVCLFGHTHKQFLDTSERPYIFNPGSLGKPSNGIPSYGMMIIEDGKIHFSLKEYKI